MADVPSGLSLTPPQETEQTILGEGKPFESEEAKSSVTSREDADQHVY
jgi:hypothetical protein